MTKPSSRTELVRQLSDREHEIALLVAEGMTNAQIAKHLTMSVNTVKVHLAAVYRKLGLQNRTQLAMWTAGQRD